MTRQNYTDRRRSNNVRGRRDSARKRKLALLICVPASVLLLGGIVLRIQTQIERAGADYCFVRTDQHQAVISLDNSLIFETSDAQLRGIENGAIATYDDAPANARVAVFTSASDIDAALIEPVFTICKPAATLAELKALGAPSKPAPYLKRQAEDARSEYLDALKIVLADARDEAKRARNSTLLERMQVISRHKYFSSTNRSLTVVTDGVQNSEIARFCVVKGDMPSFETFKKRAAYAHVRPESFDGTRVHLLLAEFGPKPSDIYPYCSDEEMRTWWPDYYRGNGAEHVVTTRLPYGVEG